MRLSLSAMALTVDYCLHPYIGIRDDQFIAFRPVVKVCNRMPVGPSFAGVAVVQQGQLWQGGLETNLLDLPGNVGRRRWQTPGT